MPSPPEPALRLRPMTPAELDRRLPELIEAYGADTHRSGRYPDPAQAREAAAREMAELLPDGVDTADMALYTAELAGQPVGWLWLSLPNAANGRDAAWVYEIVIDPPLRGKGYGRALMLLAESEVAGRGITKLALNVFGHNTVARRLYESLGFEVTSQQMVKTISP